MGTIQPQWPSFHQLRTLADKVRALQQSGGYPLAMTARELVSKEPSIPSEIRRRVAIAVAKMADGRTDVTTTSAFSYSIFLSYSISLVYRRHHPNASQVVLLFSNKYRKARQ